MLFPGFSIAMQAMVYMHRADFGPESGAQLREGIKQGG
jgi:hypothetical protein